MKEFCITSVLQCLTECLWCTAALSQIFSLHVQDSSGAQNTDLTLWSSAAVGNKAGPLLPPTETQLIPTDHQLIHYHSQYPS